MAQARAIFISYRREDSQDASGRIYDRLEARFGARQVLKDVDSFQPGADFRIEIDRLIASCDVVLAVMGPNWAGETGIPGQRRIDSPEDFVRIEVELAMSRNIPIIPLLISGAAMPSPESLPSSLAPLAYRNALRVRADPDFRRDMDRVIAGIEVNAREYRQRQRASKQSANPSGPRAVAAPEPAEPPPARETPRREEVAPPPPSAPRPAARPAASPLRRNGISAVAASILLIALSALGLLRFLSEQAASASRVSASAAKTVQARYTTQTASAGIATAAAAFPQYGYSTKTPGWACDKGGGIWNPTPWSYGGDDSTVSCASTSSTLIGKPIFPDTHNAVAYMRFMGVASVRTFPPNYEVSVDFSALTADSCVRLDTRVTKQNYGDVTEGYEFVVCPTSAEIEALSPYGYSVNSKAFGSRGSAFTMTARCVGNHLTLLIDHVAVMGLTDSAYTSTLFLAMYVETNSASIVRATLSNFVFKPLP